MSSTRTMVNLTDQQVADRVRMLMRTDLDHEATCTIARDRIVLLSKSRADDIRTQGWSVAVHNDYRIGDQGYTFWLFTKDDRCVKGEGRTDAEALDQVRAQLASFT